MTKQERQTALSIVGAVIGAGYATGREINAFFARFGGFSFLGVAGAAAAFGWLLGDGAVESLEQGRFRRLWRVAFCALLTVTGGAMLACAGEVAALVLPVHGAWMIGMVSVLAVTLLPGGGVLAVLAWASGGLTLLLIVLLVSGIVMPAQGVAVGELHEPFQALFSGVCYAGFNAALALPVMRGCSDRRSRRRSLLSACLLLALLLMLGNLAMLRHPELRGETMPLVRMASAWGKPGFYACAVVLFLAVLSTLLVCVRGLADVLSCARLPGMCLIAAVALLGLDRIVDGLYPALGALCCIMMACARLKRR